MSGNRTSWTPERRAAAATRMRARWQDPDYRENQTRKREANARTPEQRAYRSSLMTQLNERMKTDLDLASANLLGRLRSYQDPDRLRRHSERVKGDWARNPERRERQRAIAASAASKAGKASWRKRRGDIPKGFENLYQVLVRKVGMKEAMRVVRDQAAREARPSP